jgi:hypothetical protein
MSILGIILIIVAGLIAFKVTAFFVRLLLVGVVLFGLYLVFAPMMGAA